MTTTNIELTMSSLPSRFLLPGHIQSKKAIFQSVEFSDGVKVICLQEKRPFVIE